MSFFEQVSLFWRAVFVLTKALYGLIANSEQGLVLFILSGKGQQHTNCPGCAINRRNYVNLNHLYANTSYAIYNIQCHCK